MNPIAIFLASQRAVVVATSAWIVWCIIGAITAPFAPNEILLTLFVCTVVLTYAGCIWLIWPLLPKPLWSPFKIVLVALLATLPFCLMLVVGQILSNTVRLWLA